LSSGPSASTLAALASNRSAVRKLARSARPFNRALASPRATSAALPSMPMTVAPRARDRQREVADPAEEVGDPLAGARIEQRDRAAHQHAIDRRIALA
jgi:hypothetical protein